MKYIYFWFVIASFFLNCKEPLQEMKVFEDPQTQLYGIMQDNKVIIKPEYIDIDLFNKCGIAGAVHPSGEYYYINTKGKRLDISPYVVEYQTDRFSEGLARFEKNNKVGFINECGKIAIPATYQLAYPFKNGIATVRKGFKLVQLSPEYTTEKGGKYGAIDKKGKLIVPFEFDYIGLFDEKGEAVAEKDGKDININSKGEIIY